MTATKSILRAEKFARENHYKYFNRLQDEDHDRLHNYHKCSRILERETWRQQGEEEGACMRQAEDPTVLAARIQKWLMDEQQRRWDLEERDRQEAEQ